MKILKRWLTIVVGVLITIIGVILMPVPGPGGTPVTLAGLAILASELPFARKLKEKLLAFRAHYYDKLPKHQQRAAVAGVFVFYLLTSTAGYFVFKQLRQ